MAQNSKTPIMVLQELAQKNHWPPPEYDIVNSVTGTHANRFDFRVCVYDVMTYGTGASKQVSKQDAAFKALEILKARGLYNQQENPTQQFGGPTPRTSTDSPLQNVTSFIAKLRDICCENKLPEPNFVEICSAGPAHCKNFTFECRLASIVTEATAPTKKGAKQQAAKDMLERIMNTIPDLIQECGINSPSITDNISTVVKRYNDLFEDVIPNKSVLIKDYSEMLLELMSDKHLTYENFKDDMEAKNEEALDSIVSKLDLRYKKHIVQSSDPVILTLMLSTDFPLGSMGIGPTEEIALENAISQIFIIMKCFMTD